MKRVVNFVSSHAGSIMSGIAGVISAALTAFYTINTVTLFKNAIDLFQVEE